MKIDRDNTIRISSRLPTSNALKNLKSGAKITGRIIERVGDREAVLDMGGVRIRAEFLRGVPLNERIPLIFKGTDGGTLIFTIAGERSSKLDDIFAYSVFDRNALGTSEIMAIRKYIQEGPGGIFALNRFILRLRAGVQLGEGLFAELFSKLLAAGVSKDDLLFLSYLVLASRGMNSSAIEILSVITGGESAQQLIKQFRDEKTLKDYSEKLSEKLKALLKTENGTELFKELLSVLMDREDSPYREFQMPFWDEDRFKSITGIVAPGGMALTLELSQLGVLDIVIREHGSSLHINLFCEREEALHELERTVDELRTKLKGIHKGTVSIDFFLMADTMKKIIEINSSLLSNSILDFRV